MTVQELYDWAKLTDATNKNIVVVKDIAHMNGQDCYFEKDPDGYYCKEKDEVQIY